jgi:pimeloyl-ACP methyl ester carboxylesterase
MLDLLYDYQSWGRNDGFFPPAGARAYLNDLPDAELHLLDTGHFATATHNDEIAALVGAFLDSHVIAAAAA